jgi:DNA polymerase
MVADLSQIEARILAYLAGQEDVVEAFRAYDEGRGPDIYCVTASTIFGREITRDDEKERMIGKVVRLALGYGMSHVKFARVAKLPVGEATDIVMALHRRA